MQCFYHVMPIRKFILGLKEPSDETKKNLETTLQFAFADDK